jgi:tRNA(Ile)-lysidine synthase
LPSWGGELVVASVEHGGVAVSRLAEVEARGREGGESFQLAANRPSRALRKQFQAQGVPEWERSGPFLYARGELIFARGLGVDARALAAPGEPQVSLIWVPDLTI